MNFLLQLMDKHGHWHNHRWFETAVNAAREGKSLFQREAWVCSYRLVYEPKEPALSCIKEHGPNNACARCAL